MSHLTVFRAFVLCTSLAACSAPGRTQSLPVALGKAPDTSRFESELRAFESSDRTTPPPQGGVVFVGSSTFRLWPHLASDFPGVAVLNRGFGGSILPEVVDAVPRIVLPNRPRLILLYGGDNDIAAGRSPGDVVADYRRFVAVVRRTLPAVRIAFVSIKPSPSRWALVERMREANQLVRDVVARDSLAVYVDMVPPMLGADGRPRPEFFRADSLHMTPAGYALWRERLLPIVR